MDFLYRYIRDHRWAYNGLSVAFVILMVSALGFLGYPSYTDFASNRAQTRLGHDIGLPEAKQMYESGSLKSGDPVTRINIAAIGLNTVVVQGTSADALKAGAGHYPETPLPCELGNVAIAGHRTTFGKPFSNLDMLKDGDIITLETPVGSCAYKVVKAAENAVYKVVLPHDLSDLRNQPSERTLTLTTCNPKGSDKERLVVKAVFIFGDQPETSSLWSAGSSSEVKEEEGVPA